MKHKFLLVIIFSALCNLVLAQAHHDGSVIGRYGRGLSNEGFFANFFGNPIGSEGGSSSGSMGEGDDIGKRNILKTNITPIRNKVFNLQYERAIATKSSVALQLRYMPLGNFKLTDGYGDGTSFTEKFKMSCYAITPEFRIYPKQALKGFYFAPYLRYRLIDMKYGISYTSGSDTKTLDLKGSMSTFAGGLMIGVQKTFFKFLVWDFYIAGGHYSTSNIKLEASSNVALSASDQASISSDLETMKNDKTVKQYFPFNYSVSDNNVKIKFDKLNSFGFRGMGTCFGIRF